MVQARAVRQEPISAHKRAGGHGIIPSPLAWPIIHSFIAVVRRFDTSRAPLGINRAGGTAIPHCTALHCTALPFVRAALVRLDWSEALYGCANVHAHGAGMHVVHTVFCGGAGGGKRQRVPLVVQHRLPPIPIDRPVDRQLAHSVRRSTCALPSEAAPRHNRSVGQPALTQSYADVRRATSAGIRHLVGLLGLPWRWTWPFAKRWAWAWHSCGHAGAAGTPPCRRRTCGLSRSRSPTSAQSAAQAVTAHAPLCPPSVRCACCTEISPASGHSAAAWRPAHSWLVMCTVLRMACTT